MRNIALIGFMGSGKTTLASLLAAKLGYALVEIDDDIVGISQHSTVTEIFDKEGEAHFRVLEKKALASVLGKTEQVISCGGGIVSSEDAMRSLKENAVIIFLQADFKTITQRLIGTHSRPLFRDMEKATALYARRLPLYKKYADIEIQTDDRKPEDIAEMIIQLLKEHGR
jgi:shikimate kinase